MHIVLYIYIIYCIYVYMYTRARETKKNILYYYILNIINPYECDHSREHHWHRFSSQRRSRNNDKYVYIYTNATRTNQLVNREQYGAILSRVCIKTTTLFSNKNFDKYVFKQHPFSLERNAARRTSHSGSKERHKIEHVTFIRVVTSQSNCPSFFLPFLRDIKPLAQERAKYWR